ncbi:hypothetical protein N7457_004778 [Penicillium paradoxum]|uniref:uncharacterized protein n=1 Tax=Penicillium paradoxum TaxID=176176 RepID=UPI002547C74F|nr:uncharacterized protein N7457_004778 [Penicillium paradoxum]KAJ5783004.1 hypothetical protein N7457_004778 [Penicillium paradoxum]
MLSDKDNAQGEHPIRVLKTGTKDRQGTDDQNTGEREGLSAGHIQCSVCSSTFRRPEHLKRHLRSHTKEKPFECTQCGRHFSRTDTLHRHELTHHAPENEGGKERTHRITVKTFRACFSCATARVRCSGGMPCGRCDARSLECQYPTKRRSKAKATRDSNMQDTDPQNDNVKAMHLDSNPAAHLGQFAAHPTNEPVSTSKTSLNVSSTSSSGQIKPISENAHIIPDNSTPGLYIANETQRPSAAQIPLEVYSEETNQTYDTSNAGTSKEFAVRSSDNLDSQIRDLQPEMTLVENPEVSLEFDPTLFDQSILSTINWLPSELLSGTYGQAPQSTSVSSQYNQSLSPDAYFSRPAWQPPVINAGQISPSRAEQVSQTPSVHISLGRNVESPNQSSHVMNDLSPHAESVNSSKRSADYYIDGAGARLPKYRKKLTPWSRSSAEPVDIGKQLLVEDGERQFNFPRISEVQIDHVSEDVMRFAQQIELSTYDELYRNFTQLCRNKNPFFEAFDSENFPTADECNRFIMFFFDAFQVVYPILHLSKFNPNTCHWLLTLSIVALGCHVSHIPEVEQCTTALHEFIRRGIHVEKERRGSSKASLELLQAMLFNCIGLFHSSSEREKSSALSTFGDLVSLMKTSRLLAPTRMNFNVAPAEVAWSSWVQDEVRRRTGYCVWLVDCTLAYYSDDRPLLSLDDGQAALPAHETLWQAHSAETWKSLWEKSTPNESLHDAVHILYIEKRVISGIGEFSHILLIHALYHRLWEVGDYFRRPLSFWNPTAKKQSRETAIPTGSVWLPGIPSYSKWRNSACDCLDILHWTANSTVAKAAGLEHPTVLHLHAARLFLLAPYREVRSLATALATEKLRWSKRHQSLEWQYVWRWMKHDQYKARLSIIHAGVTLWHVRRYSTNAFHEPVAAFIAVLTLWAYGSCHGNTSVESTPRSEPLHEPSFVHLDRPCDDELVQLFVREGHAMRGNVTGVGDICGSEGPERVLRVGCEILSGLTAWSVSKKFMAILARLADLSSYHSSLEQNRRPDEHV